MKRIVCIFLILISFIGCALAANDLDTAYRRASKDAGKTTTALVESIDLDEFETYYGLSLSEDDIKLIRIALMSYSNGAMLEHPKGTGDIALASLETDPYVGNKNSKKFHYSWCSSVSDIKEKNKITFSSREEAIEAKFVPCKRCNP